jgi:signal-transduction protein with cAMP-binding, CBS, and nucleotidyltransferase domain
MIASELINYIIPSLQPGDLAEKALHLMEELRISQLPVVQEGRFLGLLRDEAILEDSQQKKPVENFPLVDSTCFVYESQHFYDVIKVASECGVQVVAVLSQQQEYRGLITLEDTIAAFAQTAAVQVPGAIILISLNQIDYSLTEISRLVESENAKILSTAIATDPQDATRLKLTLKINRTDVSRVISTLERFGYRITATFQETDVISNDKERLDMLMRYLDL